MGLTISLTFFLFFPLFYTYLLTCVSKSNVKISHDGGSINFMPALPV